VALLKEMNSNINANFNKLMVAVNGLATRLQNVETVLVDSVSSNFFTQIITFYSLHIFIDRKTTITSRKSRQGST
jgi:hypothetical protein